MTQVINLLELLEATADDEDSRLASRLRGVLDDTETTEVHRDHIDPRDHRVKADGVTDDTAAWKDLIGSLASSWTLQRGGRLFHPGPSVISDTIEFRRFAGELYGTGWGRGASAFKWEGPPGIPMLRIRECNAADFYGFRVTGHETNYPSALVEMYNDQSEDAWDNSYNNLKRLYLGPHPHEDSKQMTERHERSIHFTGANTNNDKNTFKNIKARSAVTAAIQIDHPQMVGNVFDTVTVTDSPIALDTNASVTVRNFLTARNGTDVQLRNSAKFSAHYWQTEKSGYTMGFETGHRVVLINPDWSLNSGSFNDPFIDDQSGDVGIELLMLGGHIRGPAGGIELAFGPGADKHFRTIGTELTNVTTPPQESPWA